MWRCSGVLSTDYNIVYLTANERFPLSYKTITVLIARVSVSHPSLTLNGTESDPFESSMSLQDSSIH